MVNLTGNFDKDYDQNDSEKDRDIIRIMDVEFNGKMDSDNLDEINEDNRALVGEHKYDIIYDVVRSKQQYDLMDCSISLATSISILNHIKCFLVGTRFKFK